MNTEGISVYGSLVDLAVQYGLITKSGAFFKVGDQNIQGREGTKNYLKENPKIVDQLRDQIWQIVKNPETAKPAAVKDGADDDN